MSLVIVALVAVGCATPLTPEERQAAYDEVAAELLEFAVQETGYDLAPVPPVSFSEVRAADFLAIYDAEAGEVVLRLDWRSDDAGRSILVHELTHYLQHRARPDEVEEELRIRSEIAAGRVFVIEARKHLERFRANCLRDEREAYEVAIRYVQLETQLRVLDQTVEDFAKASCGKHKKPQLSF